MLRGDIMDQFHDQNGLADARAAEQTDLAALGVRADQVNDFDTGLQDLRSRGLLLKGRGRAMDRPPLLRLRRGPIVNRLAEEVEDAAEALVADRDRDRSLEVHRIRAADQSVRGAHRDAAHDVIADLLRHFGDQPAVIHTDLDRVQQCGKLSLLEADVQDRSRDLDDLSYMFLTHKRITPSMNSPLRLRRSP